MIRYFTAGESHGPALTAIIEGIPAGLPVSAEQINRQLQRRQGGYGRGGRMKIESDQARILSGMRGGMSLGSPISLMIENRDWPNWQAYMDSAAADLETRRVKVPRPGHGDLAGAIKYGHHDFRNILERASARETAARVAACTIGRILIEHFGIQVESCVTRIGSVTASAHQPSALDSSELGCADPAAESAMKALIDDARSRGDSLGGVFEVRISGLPVGLGSHVQWDRKLDGRLAGALMSIQAIKGVEIGDGFATAARPGSQVHDEIFWNGQGFERGSNHAGGLEAGMTNGQDLILRAAMKPIATLYNPLRSVDIDTGHEAPAAVERSDICAVPAAAVVAEAVAAMEIARAFLEKFGGDSIAELESSYAAYRQRRFL